MSEIQKSLKLIRKGGQHFSNKSKIQKSLKYPIGGGGQAYFGQSPKFSRFLIMRSPLTFFFVKISNPKIIYILLLYSNSSYEPFFQV